MVTSKKVQIFVLLLTGVVVLGGFASIGLANTSPTAEFSYSPSTPNPDDTITLDAGASGGSIENYEWDTNGDGEYGDNWNDADDGQTTTVSFSTGGTYTIGLKITDTNGETDTITKQIVVENPAPTAEFSYSPSTPNPDDTITLDASGSSDPDGSITNYEWDTNGDGEYGDNWNDADDGQTTSVAFDSGGTYTIGLKVTDNGGKTATTTKQVTVENPPPTARFSHSPSVPNPDDAITLDASTSNDPDGSITNYEWNTNGDGEYGDSWNDADDGQTTSVAFDSGGTYTVGLKITDNGGKTVTTTKQITIENPEPSADFSSSGSNTEGLTMAFDAGSSSDPDGQIVRYNWYVEGDDAGTGQTPRLRFYEKGSYTVRLVAIDNGGAQDSITKTVSVSKSPVPEFTVPDKPIATGNQITLAATDSSDPDGTITSIQWQFSNGVTKYGETVSKEFTTPGLYTIELVVTDDTGSVGTVSKVIRVKDPPEVSIAWNPTRPADDEPIQFTATSSSPISEYRWDFNDDGYSEATGTTAEYVFQDGGSKEITLTAVGPNGLEVDVEKTVSVRDVKPKANFSWNPKLPRNDQDVVLTANSSDNIVSYKWDFNNDGAIDTEGSKVTHEFAKNGKQIVVLKVTDEHGDTASYSKAITLQRSALFEITSEKTSVKSGDEVLVKFTISNNVPNQPIRVKLNLNLPENGVGISGVNGGNLASRSSTRFTVIEPGEDGDLQLRLQMNNPGSYNITGTAVYYIGDKGSASRRTNKVGPAQITVKNPKSNSSIPGFGVGSALFAIAISLIYIQADSNSK